MATKDERKAISTPAAAYNVSQHPRSKHPDLSRSLTPKQIGNGI